MSFYLQRPSNKVSTVDRGYTMGIYLEAAIQFPSKHKTRRACSISGYFPGMTMLFLVLSLGTWRLSKELASNKGQKKGECSSLNRSETGTFPSPGQAGHLPLCACPPLSGWEVLCQFLKKSSSFYTLVLK